MARAQRRRSSGSSGHARRGRRASRGAQDQPLDAREAQRHFLHSPLNLKAVVHGALKLSRQAACTALVTMHCLSAATERRFLAVAKGKATLMHQNIHGGSFHGHFKWSRPVFARDWIPQADSRTQPIIKQEDDSQKMSEPQGSAKAVGTMRAIEHHRAALAAVRMLMPARAKSRSASRTQQERSCSRIKPLSIASTKRVQARHACFQSVTNKVHRGARQLPQLRRGLRECYVVCRTKTCIRTCTWGFCRTGAPGACASWDEALGRAQWICSAMAALTAAGRISPASPMA